MCLISVDENLLAKFVTNNLVYLSDHVIKIVSFKDHPEMKISDYDGTLRLLKVPRIHGFISAPLPDSDIYALKLKSKSGITIEKIHLDPEEDRAGQDENLMQKGTKSKSVAAVACNPTKSH